LFGLEDGVLREVCTRSLNFDHEGNSVLVDVKFGERLLWVNLVHVVEVDEYLVEAHIFRCRCRGESSGLWVETHKVWDWSPAVVHAERN